MKMKQNNRIMGKVVLGIIAIIILSTGIFLYLLLRGGLPETHNKINQYGQWENFAGYSGLKIFPKDISEDYINSYYYKSQDTIFSPDVQVFMEAVYDEESFEKEINRLSGISVSKNSDTNLILKDAEHFFTDAYVCEYNWNDCYEYALVFQADRKIDYIFLQNVDIRDVKFDVSFLSADYNERIEDSEYCIYAFGIGKNELYYQQNCEQ